MDWCCELIQTHLQFIIFGFVSVSVHERGKNLFFVIDTQTQHHMTFAMPHTNLGEKKILEICITI